ncbi:MAG: glycosyltransferase family 2 protein [Bdellovibrionales bacterium]
METKPLVSIVIPVYKGADYLAQAVQSALAQTYPHKEVIVINDGSPDSATEEVALSFGNQIRYRHKANGGVASALNRGVHEMQGRLFCWLSHDDLYYPQKLELQVQAYLAAKDPDTVVFCDFDLIEADGKPMYPVRLHQVDVKNMEFHFLKDSHFHGCTFMVPRPLFDRAGVFDESLRHVQDYDMWIRIARVAKFVRVPHVLVSGRQHEMQDSRFKRDEAVMECDTKFNARLKEYIRAGGKRRSELARNCWYIYKSHSERGHKETAKTALYYSVLNMAHPQALWRASCKVGRRALAVGLGR